MNHKIPYVISGILLAIVAVQAYTHTNAIQRINTLEAQLNSHSNPNSPPQSLSPFNSNLGAPDWFTQDPFFGDESDPVQHIRENIERLFNDPWGSSAPFERNSILQNATSNPEINVDDQQDKYVIEVSPINPEEQDVEVNVEDQRLTLTFKTKTITDETNHSDSGNTYRHAQSTRQYTRSFFLDQPVQVGTLETQTQDNVLKITIQKRA